MDNKFFKTVAVGGFDKKEVLSYIQEIEGNNKLQIKKGEKKFNELNLKFEEINNKNILLEDEISRLKDEKEKLLSKIKRLEHESNKIVEESKIFKEKYDDIAKILLDIEVKKRETLEIAKKKSEEIISTAKFESEKRINNAKELSKQLIKEGTIKYEQVTEAAIEIANLIDNSRKIFNKISEEVIDLMKNKKIENEKNKLD